MLETMSFPGSKGQAGVWQRIIGQMPPHSTYIEPFFGSGQVFWRKRPSASTIVIDRVPGNIAGAAAIAGVRAIAGDAISILPTLGPLLASDALIYCDPPYPLQTRRNRRYYEHELSDAEHVSLLKVLSSVACRVMISGYPSPLYSQALQSWRCIEYKTRTRGRTVTELLWCNFPEPPELHDWRYAGQTFRERLSLNRLAARWIARLDSMPSRKRGFLLDAIAHRHCRRELPADRADFGAGRPHGRNGKYGSNGTPEVTVQR